MAQRYAGLGHWPERLGGKGHVSIIVPKVIRSAWLCLVLQNGVFDFLAYF